MDQNFVIVSLAGSVSVIVGVVALLVKSFITDKPKTNGNGKNKQIDDIEIKLSEAISGFRESHLEERMLLKQLTKELEELKTLVGICADILKKI